MRKKRRDETVRRNVTISSFNAHFWTRAVVERRGDEPEIENYSWLTLRGTMDEPLRSSMNIEISLRPEDKVTVGTARPPSVGAIIGLKPQVTLVAAINRPEFDRLWTMAMSGWLKYAD